MCLCWLVPVSCSLPAALQQELFASNGHHLHLGAHLCTLRSSACCMPAGHLSCMSTASLCVMLPPNCWGTPALNHSSCVAGSRCWGHHCCQPGPLHDQCVHSRPSAQGPACSHEVHLQWDGSHQRSPLPFTQLALQVGESAGAHVAAKGESAGAQNMLGHAVACPPNFCAWQLSPSLVTDIALQVQQSADSTCGSPPSLLLDDHTSALACSCLVAAAHAGLVPVAQCLLGPMLNVLQAAAALSSLISACYQRSSLLHNLHFLGW